MNENHQIVNCDLIFRVPLKLFLFSPPYGRDTWLTIGQWPVRILNWQYAARGWFMLESPDIMYFNSISFQAQYESPMMILHSCNVHLWPQSLLKCICNCFYAIWMQKISEIPAKQNILKVTHYMGFPKPISHSIYEGHSASFKYDVLELLCVD